jgi:hypothetical protein
MIQQARRTHLADYAIVPPSRAFPRCAGGGLPCDCSNRRSLSPAGHLPAGLVRIILWFLLPFLMPLPCFCLLLSDVCKMVRVPYIRELPTCFFIDVLVLVDHSRHGPLLLCLCRAPDLRQPHENERPNGHLRQGPFGARVRRPARRREPPRPARSERASPSLLSTCSTSTGPVPPPWPGVCLLCPPAHQPPPTSSTAQDVSRRTSCGVW